MASVTSGSFTTGGYNGRCATFSWWVNSKSIVDNTTTIGWKLVGSGGKSNYYYLADNFKVVIDGSTVYNSSDEIELWSGTTIASGTKVISHSADGSKTFSASVSCRIYDWTVTRTGSGSWTLPNIERSSTLSVTLSSLNTEHTLTINRQNSSFTHSLTWKCGSQNGTLLTKSSSTSVKFTPSLNLASENKTGTSVWIDFTLTTYSGSATVGSTTKSGYLSIPSSVKPTCTVTVEDPTGYLATYGGYVKSKSKFKVTVTGTGSYGSSITGYSISANGSSYSQSSATTGVISSVNNNSITAKVTDSRNRTSDVISKTVTVLDYYDPSVTVNVERGDYDPSTGEFSSNISGAYCRAICKCTMTTLNSKNSGTVVLKYKKNSDSTWSSQQQAFTSATLSHTFMFAADDSYSYDILATVSDNFESMSAKTTLSTGFAIMHVNASGKGIAFGKISEGDKFEVGMPATFMQETNFSENATFQSPVRQKQGSLVQGGLKGEVGSTGYVRIMIISITSNYVNSPIMFEYVNRGGAPVSGYIRFKNANGADPDIDECVYSSGRAIPYHIVKRATSIWDIYVQKLEEYDSIAITRLSHNCDYDEGSINIEIDGVTMVASLPSGYITASPVTANINGVSIGGDGKQHEIRFLGGDHNVGIYGGNVDSPTTLGAWDWEKNRRIWIYSNTNGNLQLGADSYIMDIYGSTIRFNDTKMDTFVVESKISFTNDVWGYKKYSDGTCDLWITKTISSVSCSTAMGSWYRSETIKLAALPFSLQSIRHVANFSMGSGGNSALSWVCGDGGGTTAPSYYLIRHSSASVNGWLYVHVNGRWK